MIRILSWFGLLLLWSIPVQAAEEEYLIYQNYPGMASGYTGILPWERSPEFIQMALEEQLPIRMIAYKAVLHDPLPGEAENINLAAQKLCRTLVPAGSNFSQNQTLGPYTLENGYQEGPTYAGEQVITTIGGGICKIASLLYNAAVLSDLPILERHAHSMLVPYVPPGQDATVCYGAKDFRFSNNLSAPLLIWCQKVDDTVYLALYSQQKAPFSLWQHQIKEYIPHQTKYQTNSDLPDGSEIRAGLDGYLIQSRSITWEAPGQIREQDRGLSSYNPLSRLLTTKP